MRVQIAMAFLVALGGFQVSAQPLAPVTTGESDRASVFEKLEAKNRARYFGAAVSPGGEQYLHTDDGDVLRGEDLSPEIEVTPETRRVTSVITLYSTGRLRLEGDGSEVGIGTVEIQGGVSSPRKLDVEATLQLIRPLLIEVVPGRETAEEPPVSNLAEGGNQNDETQ